MTHSSSMFGRMLLTAGLVGCAGGGAHPHAAAPATPPPGDAPAPVAAAPAADRARFDALSFVPPPGWKRIDPTDAQNAIYLQFDVGSREHPTMGFCMFRVSRMQAARGDVHEELRGEWVRAVADKARQPVGMRPADQVIVAGEWVAWAGLGSYEGDVAPTSTFMVAYQRGNRVGFGQLTTVDGSACHAEGMRAMQTLVPAEQQAITASP